MRRWCTTVMLALTLAACGTDNGPTTPQPVVPGADASVRSGDAGAGGGGGGGGGGMTGGGGGGGGAGGCQYPPCY